MQVRVLGDVSVVRDGRALDLGGAKRRALFGILVAARDRPVPAQRLIEQVWPEGAPGKALLGLHVHVAKLRRELEPDRDAHGKPVVLVTRASGYALLLDDDAVDARRFERLVREAPGADPVRTEAALTQALALWEGPAYEGLDFCAVLAAETARLDELRAGALEQLWTARLDQGAGAEAVAELGSLANEHPVRERLWGLLATAQYRAGRQADALETLRRVRRHLAEELGIDPGQELRELERAVLRQDPGLLPREGIRPAAARPAAAAPARPPVPATGRGEQLDRAAALVEDVVAGRGRILLVSGEPGIGKTRFAELVADRAAAAGLRTAWGGWEAEGCPPLWGWTTALPELDVDQGGPEAHPGRRDDSASTTFRLADAAIALLDHAPGTCLVLDDVQWADPDSLRLLTRIAAVSARVRLLLVVAVRDPAPGAPPAVGAALASLARLEPTRIGLRGLDPAQLGELVRARTGIDVPAEVAERVHARTDGIPFYVHELLRLLSDEGALTDAGHPSWRTVPDGVRDVVRQRLAELPGEVGEVLAAAAVLGRAFDLDVLERAWTGEAADLDRALTAAVATGLVAEDGAGGYRFAHALVRDAVYGGLPALARRGAHARAAQALEGARVGHLDQHASQLAEHYRASGPGHVRSAWIWAARAARRAAERGAHEDAVRLLRSAVDLQAADELAGPGEREQVDVDLGAALRDAGRVAEAWPPLARAAGSALDRGDGVAAATALLTVTEQVIWSWRTAPVTDADAVRLWHRVLAAVPADRADLRARCQVALAVETIHEPPGARYEELVDEALEAARRAGDDALLADVLQMASTVLRSPDLVLRRMPVSDELVELCARREDERGLALALCKRAANSSALGRPERAAADLARALVLARRHHLAPVLMVVQLGLGVLAQAAGDFGAAERHLAEAEAVQATLAMAGGGIGLSQRATALLVQGRLAELEPVLAANAHRHAIRRVLRELRALAVVAAGRTGELRAELGPWSEQPELPWDYLWVSATALRGLVWAALGDPDAVADLRRQLAPYADRPADGAMAAFFLGSVHHTLGELALAAGDHPDARRHAAAALDTHRAQGWPAWERLSADLLRRATAPAGTPIGDPAGLR